MTNIKKISNVANISDKQSWNRKYENLQQLIATVRELSENIAELEIKKYPIIDEINMLRSEMVQECIHPSEMLIDHNGTVGCKFCNKTFKI